MKTKLQLISRPFIALALWAAVSGPVSTAFAQGTAFTYQGRLFDGTNAATGNYDLRFQLWNALTGGSTVTGFITNAPIAVSNGLFTTTLDFGAGVFTGPALWLHIGVRTNGSAGGYTALVPRQPLTPTPYAIFAEGANAAGLTGTIPAGGLSGVSGTGLSGVALLAGGNSFTGNQVIGGALTVSDGAGATHFTDMTIGPGGYFGGEEHSINFDDSNAHIGSLIFGYNGNGYFSFGNLYYGSYQSGTKAFTVYGNGNVNVDPDNLNNGFLNNGNTNSSGLTFGSGSGEGIASQRTAGGNQYGLDFYTAFSQRMSLNNSGNLMLDGNDLYLLNASPYRGIGYRTSVAGVSPSGGDGIFVYGYDAGYLGTRGPDAVALTWDWHNNVTVYGEFLTVNGLTPVMAYIGDDGVGNDVQIGSQKSGITALAAYNTADNAYMHFYCSSITIEGGSDLAEPFKITPGKNDVPQGAVVVIDEQNPGHLKLSDQSYDTRVAGVVSGANGINPGIQMQQQGLLDGGKNVALTGRVYVQADASNGPIKPGDLLTTSSTPGHAMKVTDHARAAGAILGKAMTGLSEGKGMVLVLVTLQ
jgi:hypothetical protein